jgi:manganese transport protein
MRSGRPGPAPPGSGNGTMDRSLPEVHRSIGVPGRGRWVGRFLAFAGPGYLISVGYMDPGNWATDIAGGSRFGYALLAVILLSNLMAILLQALSVRLGVALAKRFDCCRRCSVLALHRRCSRLRCSPPD